MKTVLIAAFLITACTTTAFAAEPDPKADRQIRVLLFAHHGPPAVEVFERAVPDARARLLVLAQDANTEPVIRDRALIALAGFGGQDVRALYDRVLADRQVRDVSRVHVLASYARAFPKQARAVLQRAEASEEPAIRAAAKAHLKTLPR